MHELNTLVLHRGVVCQVNGIHADRMYLYVPVLEDDMDSTRIFTNYCITLHDVDRVVRLKGVLSEEDYQIQLDWWNNKYPTLKAI